MKLISQRILACLLGLTLFTAAIGCETSRTSAPSPPDDPVIEEVHADTIFVYGVGYLTLEELFGRFMSDRLYGNEVSAYADAILKTKVPGAADSVVTYTDRRYTWWGAALEQLAQAKRAELGPWLEANADRLETGHWSDIGSTLAHSGWRDSVVAEVLMEQLHQNPKARARIARAFVGMGTLEEVRTIVAINDTTSSKWLEWTAIAAQARFDVPEFNKNVRAALRDTSRLHTRMLEGLEENHRHDLLPELRTSRDQLRGNWPDYSMSYLDNLIAELEAKKAEGVTPGAPLDYPNGTRADSTSS